MKTTTSRVWFCILLCSLMAAAGCRTGRSRSSQQHARAPMQYQPQYQNGPQIPEPMPTPLYDDSTVPPAPPVELFEQPGVTQINAAESDGSKEMSTPRKIWHTISSPIRRLTDR